MIDLFGASGNAENAGNPGIAANTSRASQTSASGVQIWVALAPVDMRKGFDRLAEIVRTFLGQNPLGGHLFVFRNRSSERVKILWWDDGGYVLFYKRLERGVFRFPVAAADRKDPSADAGTQRADGAHAAEQAVTITSTQLLKLLSGLEIVARR